MSRETLMSRCAASTRAQRAVSSSRVMVTFLMTRFSCYTGIVSTAVAGRQGRKRLFENTTAVPERDALFRRLAAFFAPVAADAGAVTDDLVSLDLADGIYQAFGDLDADGGLTRSELAAACADLCDQATFDSRFELFCRMGMLLPVRDKAHQIRYVFNPTSAAALLVFERLVEAGGVQEILTLLDRTRDGLHSGMISQAQVAANLTRARQPGRPALRPERPRRQPRGRLPDARLPRRTGGRYTRRHLCRSTYELTAGRGLQARQERRHLLSALIGRSLVHLPRRPSASPTMYDSRRTPGPPPARRHRPAALLRCDSNP
jgi:hypothetical protein